MRESWDQNTRGKRVRFLFSERDKWFICGHALTHIKFVLSFSHRALFLLSKGMVSLNHSPQTKSARCVNLCCFLIMQLFNLCLWPCSYCWWRGSWARSTRCWHYVGRLWRTGRETPFRRSRWEFSSWCCRLHTTWMLDRYSRGSFPALNRYIIVEVSQKCKKHLF